MKKIILLLLIVFAVFVVYNRQRLYLRDPLGSLTRDGVEEQGAQIYINYSNDVLIQNDRAPAYMTLVQHDRPIGSPNVSVCMHFVVCMLDADQATLLAVAPKAKIESMSNKLVTFTGGDGREAVVKLR